jgi:RNA polymerase sigma factor (TIGR02999 family)
MLRTLRKVPVVDPKGGGLMSSASLPAADGGQITGILHGLNQTRTTGSEGIEHLYALVHHELHRIAQGLMRRERAGHTLQATALVNEMYLRLDVHGVSWHIRAHFYGVAARAMRQILVDHARKYSARKRGGDIRKVSLDDAMEKAQESNLESLALETIAIDRALHQLSEMDERMAQVVELRVFAALDMNEIAAILGISRRTVYDDWDFAKRWLARELGVAA